MSTPNTHGPRTGDRVQVEAPGEVLATEVRDGTRWVDVRLDHTAGDVVVSLPAELVVLLRRPG